jgi:hypothetical protein
MERNRNKIVAGNGKEKNLTRGDIGDNFELLLLSIS